MDGDFDDYKGLFNNKIKTS